MQRSEDTDIKRHHIPMQDYDTLSIEQLVDETTNLVENDGGDVSERIMVKKSYYMAKPQSFIERKRNTAC
jgi:hypothetical protein